jgi:polyribonucleotide nucleotidyltransferase
LNKLELKFMLKTKEHIVQSQWLGRTLTIKTGKLAQHADAAVTVQSGDTVVLATVVQAKEEREGIDFFPLMVDCEERLYAAGIIKGSRWVKREGRPTDASILTGRMVDRSIRPLFDDSSRREVQVILTVLSADKENDHDIVALVAASAALSISGVKWAGPIGGVRVGRIDGEFIFNPTYEQREASDIDVVVAGTKQKTIMIEAGANECKEEDMLAAIVAGQERLQGAMEAIEELKSIVPAREEKEIETLKDPAEIEEEKEKNKILEIARGWLEKNIEPILFDKVYYTKSERKAAVKAIKEGLDKYLFEQNIEADKRAWAIKQLVEKMVEAAVTQAILEQEKRVDGRGLDEIRPLNAEAGILPRNHGSGLFSRGETQVMSIVTLGPPGVEQMLEGVEGLATKRFMHHYNFPPYSVGEVRRLFSPGRREIGHGALAEKALEPMIPPKEEFPYTIRVVSETLSSNGSSSMASTCASSLALMDAGVPIKKAVAGIAMGLASNEDMSQWKVLTDIQDLEDGKGGMDFKITGTRDGITAIQLDTKTNGLTVEIIKTTLEQGRKARLQILDVMDKAIDKPRADLSPYAPRVITLHINPEKIRDVIGTGGRIINSIIEATGVAIDIEDDGTVFVSGPEPEKCQEAVTWIENLTREVEVGEKFKGKVVRMLDFGAFVEILPGREGMVHVSELAPFRVEKPSDILQVGDIVNVQVKEIDDMGRINLTMIGLEENTELWQKYQKTHPPRPPRPNMGNTNRFRPNGPRPGGYNNRPQRRLPRHGHSPSRPKPQN